MLTKKAWGTIVSLKHCRLAFPSHFSTNAGDGAPPASPIGTRIEPHKPLHRQLRSFSSGSGSPPRSSSATDSASGAGSGTDYLSLFTPTNAAALAPYSPGNVLKMYPLPRYVLKEDIVRHVEGSNVKPENVKIVYGSSFRPDYAQFTIESDAAQKQIMRRVQERGRMGYRLLKAELSPPMPWTVVDAALKDSPRGRTLLMHNAGVSTDFEDVERFFLGYRYDPSYIRFIRVNTTPVANRPGRRPFLLHVAVGFTTKLEALRAMREKMGDFCANVPINLRLIQ